MKGINSNNAFNQQSRVHSKSQNSSLEIQKKRVRQRLGKTLLLKNPVKWIKLEHSQS